MAMADVKRTIKDFDIFVASFAKDAVTKHYRNGFAVHLYYTNGKHRSNTARILDECLQQSDSNYVPNIGVISSNLYRLVERVSVLKKSMDKSWHVIEDLLLKPLHVPVSSAKKRRKVSEATAIVQYVDKNLLYSPPLKINSSNTFELSTVGAQERCMLPHLDQQQQGYPPSAVIKKLKTDCEKCSKIRKSYIMAVSELKFKLRSSRKSLREMSKLYNIRCVNQNMKRKDAARDRLRIERKALKKENFKLKNEVKRLKTMIGKENVDFPRNYKIYKSEKDITGCNDLSQKNLEMKTLTNKAQTKEERIQELEVEINKLMCELKLLQEEHNSVTNIEPDVDPELESEFKRSKIQKSQKHDSRSVDISFCSQEISDISMGGWCEVDKVTDIPTNVAIEIEEQTYITVLDNGALEPFNHKDSGEEPTNPADIFTTNMIDNSKVAFKSVNGKYWSLQTDGKVASIAETLGTREQFEPVFQGGKLALIGSNKCFLSYNEEGNIVCESCTADSKNWFKLRSIPARMKDPVEEGIQFLPEGS